MKTRTLITLLLSAGLTLSALAQQPNSSSSAQPAASADQDAPLSSPASRDFWDGDEPSVGALLLHPFARKEYVRRHVQPISDRVNELDELTAAHHKMITDVDARAQQGIQLASAKVSLADDHASQAASQAQMAHQAAATIDSRVSTDETIVAKLDRYQSGSLTEIRFRPGETVLSKQAKDALDEMAAPLKNQHGYVVEVQGFASGQGQAAIANSRKMADAVERYLVLNHEIPAYRIYVIGMSNAAGGTRVEVSVLKNEIEQTAKQ
jgi:outer membrane protein OmpA-like peptidoglycan-associated protein